MGVKARIFNFLIALDQFLFNVACLGQTYPSETASSAAWRLEQLGYWQGKLARPFVDWLMLRITGEYNHCRTAYEHTMAGKFLPPPLPPKD